MYSYGPPHMAEQKQDNQLGHTYCSSAWIRDVALNTGQRGWTIGRSSDRGSGISVLVALHDDDDDDEIYIYIYIYIYWQHFLIDSYLIELKRHFLSTNFFVNPFELQYWSFDFRPELVDKPSIISYFPSTFCPTFGHHQGRMYYKRDVTFVCTLLLCKNKRLHCCIV